MSKRKKNTNWGENGFEDWGGYMAAKKAKLEEQFQIIASKEFQNASTLFQGIAIFVNGYTNPSADELKRLMMAHGGIYHHYMRPRITTHIIASNLPYSKIVMYRKSQHPVPICKPEWISDSLKAGRVLDYQQYLLYTNCTETQPRLMFKAGGTNEKLATSSNNGTKDQNCPKFLSETANQSIKDIATTLSVIKNNKPVNSEEILSENDPSMLDKSNNEKFTKPNSGTLKNINAARIVSTSFANSSVVQEPTKESAVNQRQVQNAQPKTNQNNSTQNAGFLTEFYNNSRLHHIATMGATFKDYINELRDKSDGTFPGLDRLKSAVHKTQTTVSPNGNDSDSDTEIFDVPVNDNGKKSIGNIVMHIDMDCFFVSVGLRNKPELVGQPVAVAHAKGNRKTRVPAKAMEEEVNDDCEAEREDNMEDDDFGSMSEVASCSYEARKAGVKNGMFLGQALKLCPNLKTIRYDFEGYKEVSYALYDTVASYTLNIEAVSCDEMYADCTSILAETGLNPMQFAKIIRKEIRDKTGCPVSTGFGGNKLQARLATKKAKPDGQFYLQKEMVRSYIGSLNVRDLPGVGMSTTHKLKGMLVQTCAELQNISLASLQKEFGKKTGEMLHNMSRGVDNSKLNLEHVRKSVSAEVNYGIRFRNSIDAEDFLKKLSVEVCARMKKANVKGRSVTLKVMVRAKEAPIETAKFMGHGLCDYYTRSKNFIAAVDDDVIVTREVLALWNQLQQKSEEIRGIGIQISRLESLKSKAGNTNILNFINKIKPCDSENKHRGCDENELLLHNIEVNSISKKSDGGNGKSEKSKKLPTFFSNSMKKDNLDRQHTREYPGSNNFKIDDSILPALPEDIKNEILHAKHNTVNFEHNKEVQQPGPSKIVTTRKLNMLGKPIQNEESLPPKIKKDVCPSSDNNVSNKNTSEEKLASNLQNPFMTSDHNNSLINVLMESETNQETNILQLTQDLDEAVLAELPEDIRNEILSAKIIKKNKNDKKDDEISRPSEALVVDKTSSKSSEPGQICISEKKSTCRKIQTSQESYFRHTKPSTSNSTKAKLPPIEQINMAVLVELPEEIRNEILNEYRIKQQEETSSLDKKAEMTLQTEHNIAVGISEVQTNFNMNSDSPKTDLNVSFSQVDPEYLAALPVELRNDVKQYCTTKKIEKEMKIKKNQPQATVSKGLINFWSKSNANKNSNKPKTVLPKGTRKTKNTNNTKTFKATKNSKLVTENREKSVSPTYENATKAVANTTAPKEKAVPSEPAPTPFVENPEINEEEEILNKLVNRFLNLPLKQVKSQIQMWISSNNDIIEIDVLSLITFLSSLPERRRLTDLHTLLKMIHRCIARSGNCVWHRTYKRIVEHVQNSMRIEYNSDLILPPMRCELAECEVASFHV